MPILEFHDAEIGNSHAGSAWGIHTMTRAEELVSHSAKTDPHIVKWVLRSERNQEVRRWERDPNATNGFKETYNLITGQGEPEPVIPTQHAWHFRLNPTHGPHWACVKCSMVAHSTSDRERTDMERYSCSESLLN